MRTILIQIKTPHSYREMCEAFAKEMGFGFYTNEDSSSPETSSVIWGGTMRKEMDYWMIFDGNRLRMKSQREEKTEMVAKDEFVKKAKRFVLDQESLRYIGKTQNQIGGKFQKMKRMSAWEGLGKKNKILVQNPETQTIQIGQGEMKNAKITIYGENNTLIIEDGFRINHMELLIRGSNNYVKIGKKFELNYNTDHGPLCLSAKDDGNRIVLGDNIHVRGSAEMVCMEGTELVVGDNFGMSNETIIRTGDGHRIFGADGERVNPAKSIYIGKDCWLARRGVILKGVELKDYTIVGTAALVTKRYDRGNIVLGGNPAKIIREDVTWLPGR